jgi:hypothetical protein
MTVSKKRDEQNKKNERGGSKKASSASLQVFVWTQLSR